MTTPTQSTPQTTVFTATEWRALQELHARYHQDRDLFTERERGHLRFMRWLYQTRRVVP